MGTVRDKVKRAVRKTVKWGGLVITLSLVAIWLGSRWFRAGRITHSGHVFAVSEGLVMLSFNSRGGPMSPAGWFATESMALRLNCRFRWIDTYQFTLVYVPLWFPALLSLLATAAAWRVDLKYIRRARAGLCGSCGYDRAGLAAAAVCPECGAVASVSGATPPAA